MSTTSQLSNYVSCLGNNDAVIIGTNYDLDVSFNTANTAVSLLSAQIVISKVFPMPSVSTGNGFTISGWFLPYGKTQKSNALLIEMDTSVNPTAVYLTGGSSYSLNAVYNGVVISTNSDISAGMVLPQTWNYFCYTVECSGNTVGTAQAIQSLYLNGSSIPVVNTTASYVSSPFTVTYMGKGTAYTNQFQGKLAEMRSFQRILNPAENRILSACNNVGSPGAVTIMPSVVISSVSSTGIYDVPYTMTNTIAFSSASVFSYVTISRSPVFLYAPTTVNVSLSALQRVNGNLLWNDVSVNASTSYTYTITPFVSGNGSSPMTTLITSGIAHGPPTPLLLSGSYKSPNVVLSWTGGLGDNVVLTYTLTGGTANTTTGNLTYNIAGGSANLPITGTGPWTYQVTATNSKGTVSASTKVSMTWSTIENKTYTITNAIANFYSSTSFVGVAVDMAQSRMLFMNNLGIYYATSSNTGASWSAFTLIPNTASGLSDYNRASGAVCLSQDGTKGLGYGFAGTALSIYWPAGSGNVPTSTSVIFNGGFAWSQVSGKADGSVAVIGSYAAGVFYLTWNYTTNVYNAPIQFSYNGSLIYSAHMATCISPNGLILLTEQMPGNTTYFGWITLTWSTTTPPVPTLNSNWNPTLQNTSPNGASIIFLGGTDTIQPTNVLLANVGGPLFLYSWNNVTHTLTSTFQPVTSTWGMWGFSMSAVGPNGNIVYFVSNITGTTAGCINISYITLNVS